MKYCLSFQSVSYVLLSLDITIPVYKIQNTIQKMDLVETCVKNKFEIKVI